jgi:hypothetical protein
MDERRGNPTAAILIFMMALELAGFIFAMGQGCADNFGNTDPTGWKPGPGCAKPSNVTALVVLVCGVVVAALAGLVFPPFPRRPAASPAESPAPAPLPTPAVFAPCPGCGHTVNRRVGRCPYCQALVEGEP